VRSESSFLATALLTALTSIYAKPLRTRARHTDHIGWQAPDPFRHDIGIRISIEQIDDVYIDI